MSKSLVHAPNMQWSRELTYERMKRAWKGNPTSSEAIGRNPCPNCGSGSVYSRGIDEYHENIPWSLRDLKQCGACGCVFGTAPEKDIDRIVNIGSRLAHFGDALEAGNVLAFHITIRDESGCSHRVRGWFRTDTAEVVQREREDGRHARRGAYEHCTEYKGAYSAYTT